MASQVGNSGLLPGTNLAIRLAPGKTSFKPGDTVEGYVYRTTLTNSNSAQLRISLHGQSTATVQARAGYATTSSSSRFIFFNTAKTTQVLHFNQPLNIQADSGGHLNSAQWPFTLTIPTSADPESIARPGIPREVSYLPLDPDSVATQPLPPSFQSNYSTGGKIEYYLKAELHLIGQRKSFFGGHYKTETFDDVEHLDIEQVPPPSPLVDFQLRKETMIRHVVSQRLAPGMEDTKLSFSQKALKTFGSSKVPRLMLQILVGVPSVMQLENENTIPFLVNIEPMWDQTSEVLRGADQHITLEHMTVRLKPTASYSVVFESRRNKPTSPSISSQKIDLLTVNRRWPHSENIQIPYVAGDTCKRPEHVDVGKLVDFNLRKKTIKALSIGLGRHEMRIYPSFTTYNIKYNYEVSWKLSIAVVGEEIELSGGHPVILLPAGSQDAYPDEKSKGG